MIVMEYCVSIAHDEINRADFIAHCLRGLGVANGQIFDFPIDLCRRPYTL